MLWHVNFFLFTAKTDKWCTALARITSACIIPVTWNCTVSTSQQSDCAYHAAMEPLPHSSGLMMLPRSWSFAEGICPLRAARAASVSGESGRFSPIAADAVISMISLSFYCLIQADYLFKSASRVKEWNTKMTAGIVNLLCFLDNLNLGMWAACQLQCQ